MDPRVAVFAAAFEQQHAVLARSAQAVGQHAAGWAGPDHDVVELFCCHDYFARFLKESLRKL
ncbi:hypothetical protein D3C78_1921200 [compost metagenome]